MTTDEKGFLAALETTPEDVTARSAYADWLDEHNRPYEAALQRSAAGLSEVFFKLRRKSDGLFSECEPRRSGVWTTKGKLWPRLADLRAHLYARCDTRGVKPAAVRYWSDEPLKNLEVVMVEVRSAQTAALPIVCASEGAGTRQRTTITVSEPTADEGRT